MKASNSSKTLQEYHAILVLISLVALGALVPGCLDDGADDILDLVMVTIPPQIEMVERIAGPGIEVVVMVPVGQSPHSYSPTPGQLMQVSKADIYFKMGSNVEFEVTHMGTIVETNTRMEVVDCSEGLSLKDWDEHLGGDHHGEEEAHEGDEHDHEGTDPHVWLSPSNMMRMASTVLEAFVLADPDNEDVYRENHVEYISELNETISSIDTELGPYAGSEFLVYHPAWGYFADEFGLVQMAIEDAGTKPGPQGIAAIIEQAVEHNITVVFVEPQFDSSAATEIAREIGGRVVSADPMAADYMENLKAVAADMKAGFL